MRSSSSSNKVIMGAAVVMVVTLAVVFAVVLVLLAELYCTLLFRKRNHRPKTPSNPTDTHCYNVQSSHLQSNASSLNSFYAQGVLHAPRNCLFPALENQLDLEKQLHLSPIYHHSYPHLQASPDSSSATSSAEQLIYICNPVYSDDEVIRRVMSKVDTTPFETPATSPSHLELMARGSSSSSSSSSSSPPTSTPPLTPIKKLSPECPSVSLRDARSLCTTPSGSNYDDISASSSASPSTSPSW